MQQPIKNSLEYKYYGPEPTVYDLNTLNWYSAFCNKKDYVDFMKTYLKMNKLKLSLPSYIPGSIAIAAHFSCTKRALPEEAASKLEKSISELEINTELETEERPSTPKKSVLDYVKDQARSYCAIIDGEIDSLIDNFDHKFNIKAFAAEIKAPQAKLIKEFYEKQYNDTLINDEFTKEGYSYMSRKEFKIYQKFLKDIIDTMSMRMIVPKRTTVRKKKETPAYKKVQNLKYLDMSKMFNIQSESPERIIKSDMIIAFDTKSLVLSVYIAEKGGFDVSGSTIKNIDDKSSFKKKLRRPEDFLKNINKTKLQLLRIIEDIKTKPSKIGTRLNDKTVILKVF